MLPQDGSYFSRDRFGSLNDVKSHKHDLLLKEIVYLRKVIVSRGVFLVVDPYLLASAEICNKKHLFPWRTQHMDT